MNEREIFMAALQLDDARRGAYLDGACGADPGIRQRVDALMQAFGEAGSFLEHPAAEHVATIDRPCELSGTLIGPYKLLEQIGEGGMGLVYMAEQQQPVRRLVALKIIKPGFDSKQTIARFEAERQALAMMDHPNIAKIFDAGTTAQSTKSEADDRFAAVPGTKRTQSTNQEIQNEQTALVSDFGPSNLEFVSDFGFRASSLPAGRPYFVMELVRGLPINEFCDQQKLTVRQRLELFIQVCQAIQHAHHKGIIHRDLKPTNVLVTMNDVLPIPKVIDFGIAKALGQSLTEHTLHTGFAQLVGTPLYMSPEQAQMNQLGVDTRSDVYSLGVLLYELLTGTTPFDKDRLKSASFDEMRRIIREEEPETVSTRLAKTRNAELGARNAGTNPKSKIQNLKSFAELDWIVMKSLEKDRSRRYESSSALSADIQRYLSDEPVLACPLTAMYRFQKFARKHQPALATAAAIAACLILGTTVSAWQAVRATAAEAQATANEAQAKEAAAAEAQQRQRAEANEQQANTQRSEAERQRDEVKALNEQLRRTLYASNINLAKSAWDAGNIERVDELLDNHRPKPGDTDLRGFEWYYLHRLCHVDLLTLKGYFGWGSGVACSPDGKCLAYSSRDNTVKITDAQSGQELLSLKGHTAKVWSVAFSPDGKHLVSASGNGNWDDTEKDVVAGEVKVWDVQTGQNLLTLKGHSHVVMSAAFSPDGKRLASASRDKTIKMWDAQTGQELFACKGHSAAVNTVAFSPDGKHLASGDHSGAVKTWDAQSGQELLSLKGHTYWVFSVTFSPDGKRLAGAGTDGAVKVWDALTGQELVSLQGYTAQANSVAFSPDGKRLVSACQDQTVKLFDSETGQVLVNFRGHTGIVDSVAFNSDGTRLVSGAQDGTVKVWDATNSQNQRTFGEHTGAVQSLAISPDGKRLAVGSGSLDDAKKAYIAGEVKVWDAQSAKELFVCKGHAAIVNSVAFSPDGNRLASAASDQTVKLWDANNGQELLSFKGGGSSVAFSPDGKRLASGSGTPVGVGGASKSDVAEEVKVWDVLSGNEILSLKGSGGVAFSLDGKRLATGGQRNVKVWDAQTGQELLTLNGVGGNPVAFSADGKRLASGRRLPDSGVPGFGEVRVWDAQTGELLFTLKGHTGHISSVLFSPDGTRLVSGDWWTRTMKIWDAQTGQELLAFKVGRGVHKVAFSPNGYALATAGPRGVTIYGATPLPEKP